MMEYAILAFSLFNLQKQTKMKKSLLISCFALLICGICNGQTWTPNKSVIKAPKDSIKTEKKAFQCWGTTQKGVRCKRHVNIDRSFCYQHTAQAK